MTLPIGLTLIQTKTATNQSALTFVPGLLSQYDIYMIAANSVLDSSTAGTSLVVQLSTNGGVSYINNNYGNGDIGLQLGFLDGGSYQLSFVAYIMNITSGSAYIGSISNFLRTVGPSGGTYGDFYTVNNTTADAFQITSGDGTNFSGKFSLYGVIQ